MNRIPIVFAFDENMIVAAGVCMTSLLLNADKETFYDIYVLHKGQSGLSGSKLQELPEYYRNCRISFLSVGDEYAGSYQVRGITDAAYYRLLAAEMLPEIDKFLYSDVDVIFREDQNKFYEPDLKDCCFASVNSVPVMNTDYLQYINSIGLDPKNGYYYAGNLVVNAAKIRNDGLTQVFLSHKDKKYRFMDMDIINLSCTGSFMPLPPAFCMTVDFYEAITKERERLRKYYSDEEMDYALKQGIVHYNGAKPWNTVCPNMDIWWDYYRKSIFFDEKFTRDFWYNQTYRVEQMSLWKRIKLVGRFFRKGGRR